MAPGSTIKHVRHFYDDDLAPERQYLGSVTYDPRDDATVAILDRTTQTKDFQASMSSLARKANTGLEIALRFNPVSTVAEVVTGKDIVTGESLGLGDYALAAAGALGPIDELIKTVRVARRFKVRVGSRCAVVHVVDRAGEPARTLTRAEERVVTDVYQSVDRAKDVTGPGRGATHGTKTHVALRDDVRDLARTDLHAEVSYKGRELAIYGEGGSIRVDVMYGKLEEPVLIFDLKTGSGRLTQRRVAEVRAQLPREYQNLPIIEVR